MDVLRQVLMNVWIARRWSTSSSPASQDFAVAGKAGGIGWPVKLVCCCSCPASRIRRRASAGLMRTTSAITFAQAPPSA